MNVRAAIDFGFANNGTVYRERSEERSEIVAGCKRCLIFRRRPIIIMGMSTQPIVFALNDENLKRMIREAARDTARVFFTPHAKKRMKQRRITPTQVYLRLFEERQRL